MVSLRHNGAQSFANTQLIASKLRNSTQQFLKVYIFCEAVPTQSSRFLRFHMSLKHF